MHYCFDHKILGDMVYKYVLFLYIHFKSAMMEHNGVGWYAPLSNTTFVFFVSL